MTREATLVMDRDRLEKLRKRYQLAVDNNEKQFEFEGNLLVLDYAKYMIEYLDFQFRKRV
jgi:hypothetical protein